MPEKSHFALKEGVEGFADAAVAVPPDGRPLSVAAELKKGKGVISTDDENEIAALDNIDALKQVPASQVADARKSYKPAKEES